MNIRTSLLPAVVASAAAVAFVSEMLMIAVAFTESTSLPLVVHLYRVFKIFAVTLLLQLLFGCLLWHVLAHLKLAKLSAFLVAYVVPVMLIGIYMADTYADLEGTLAWAALAFVASSVFWVVARKWHPVSSAHTANDA